jgi:hypothetical protein
MYNCQSVRLHEFQLDYGYLPGLIQASKLKKKKRYCTARWKHSSFRSVAVESRTPGAAALAVTSLLGSSDGQMNEVGPTFPDAGIVRRPERTSADPAIVSIS